MDDSNPIAPVTDAQAAAGTASTPQTGAPTGTAGEFNASTTVQSLQDLKEKAPTLYRAMMEGIAMNIVNDMKDHQEKLKQMMREAERDAAGG